MQEGSSATLRVGPSECRDRAGSNMNNRDGRAHGIPRQAARDPILILSVGVSPARALAKIRGPIHNRDQVREGITHR